MRRVFVVVIAAVVLVACGDDEPGITTGVTASTVQVDAALPAPLQAFVDGVAEPGTVAFRASYRVRGAQETSVEVLADPPAWQLRTGDLIIVGGRDAATCKVSTRRCVPGIREALLAPSGVFSRFFSTGTARILATDGRRSTAGAPVTSERTVAGVAVRCIDVPVGGRVASSACLTAEGVVATFDNAATHVELTAYAVGAPGESLAPPYELTDSNAF